MEDDVVIEPEDSEGGEQTSQSKLKDLREKLANALKERDQYLEGWQRAKADYINLKNRSEEERKSAVLYGIATLTEELLPAIDSFEGALSHVTDVSIKSGLEQTYNKLIQALEAVGLTKIDPKGEPFNPERHESVDVVAVESRDMDNIVTTVHQKGYSLNGKTIRPARVAVGHYKE